MKNNSENDNSYTEHEIESSGELTVKSTRTQNLLMRIGAFVIAFIIWVYASSQNEVTKTATFKYIPVSIVTDSSLTLLSDDDEKIDITVSGKLRDINKLTSGSFSATADASDISEAGHYSVPINVKYPRSVELNEQSVSAVTIDIDVITSVQKEVKVKLLDYNVSEPYEVGDAVTDIEKVKISGPQLLLNRIDRALCTVQCDNLSSSTTCYGKIVPVDENGTPVTGALILSNSDCKVYIPVYFKKSVPLKAKFKYNYCNESNTIVTVTPSTVTIKGEEQAVKAINEITIDIDETKLLSNSISREIKLPEGIINTSKDNAAVVDIELLDTADFAVELTDITYINPAVLDFTAESKSVSVILRGQTNAEKYFDSERLSATVDLSSYSAGVGEVSVPLNVTISAGPFSSTTYVLGDYTQKLIIN